MQVEGKNIVVTGGASGIGKALAERFTQEGAQVIVADRSQDKAQAVADAIGGLAVGCDVTVEQQVQDLVAKAQDQLGAIDLFCSNAGVCFGEEDLATSATNEQWQACWDVHVMAHVYAARAVLPAMIERGEGYLLQMASAAGLLNQIGDAAYSASKHAAVGFAESLAITHGEQGIRVSVICPQYVATPMLGYGDGENPQDLPGVLVPSDVAQSVIDGLAQERFLILPHPQVGKFIQHKTGDYGRWLKGMQRLRGKILDEVGSTQLDKMHKLV